MRTPRIKRNRYLLGRRRWHFRSPRLYTRRLLVRNQLRSFIDGAECSSNFARYGSRIIVVRIPRIKRIRDLLGRRRWHFRSPRLYTRLGAESIAIIHRRRGMLLQLCTIWLEGHCRADPAYQKNLQSARPPTVALWFTTPARVLLHDYYDDIRGVRLEMVRVLL